MVGNKRDLVNVRDQADEEVEKFAEVTQLPKRP